MKKLSVLLMLLFAVGFVLAQQYGDGSGPANEEIAAAGGQGGTPGATPMQGANESGQQGGNEQQLGAGPQAQIQMMSQNRFQLQANGIQANCEGCNLTQERVQNRTMIKMKLSNGRNAEIKVMPDVASETALQRLRLRNCNESNNCTIQLKEVGEGNQTRATYEIQVERHARILGIFQAKMQNQIRVDAENGEIVRAQKPWWAFLATEPEE